MDENFAARREQDSLSMPNYVLIVIFVSGVGVLAFFGGMVAITIRKRREQQDRLERSFERARLVRENGNGIQGKPYSVYGPLYWR
jgi:hypothetical protein